jgi:hypothetical protein
MVELISIHIPRTAGTSFYQVLKQVYGDNLSISLRRKDLNNPKFKGDDLSPILTPNIKAIHGHVYYYEVRKIHLTNNSKVICWLREPTSRVISNYRFFMHGLRNPEKNKAVYQINKHRINETLLEFSMREENRNRISKFLGDLSLDELFFFGIIESFNADVMSLAKKLKWPDIIIPHLNNVPSIDISHQLDGTIVDQIKNLNNLDIELYNKALEMKQIN